MKIHRYRGVLAMLAVLAAGAPALQVACGGSASAPAAPADTTAPVVTISGISGTAITAPATLTFTFSEDVGSSFTASDVVVTNGTAAASVTKVDATHYTLVVTPPANASGTMQISIPAGAFTDLAGNPNAAVSPVSQPYNTVVIQTYPVIDFTTALASPYAYKLTSFGNTVSVITSTGVPTGGPAGSVAQITKAAGAEVWAGTTLSVGYLDSVGRMPFSATATKLTARVYAPAAGTTFKLKVEDAADPTHSVETDTQTAATGWQTLTFDFAAQSSGTAALNPAFTYNKVSIFPAFGSAGVGTVYFVGPVTFVGAAAASAAPLVAPAAPTAPTTAPARPSKAAAGVISLLSDAYTNRTVNTWRTDWSSATLTDVTIGGDHMKKYSALDFVGIETTGANMVDASQMTHLHMDVWTAEATTFRIKLVDWGADGAFGGGDDTEHELVFTSASTPALATGAWVAIDVPFTSFANLAHRNHLAQYILSAIPTAGSTVYVDNFYFYNSGSSAPTAPTTAPARPTVASGSVISLLSDAYTNHAVNTWRTDWSSATLTDVTIGGDHMKKYSALDFVGIEATGANVVDASQMTHVHLDVWTPDATTFRIKLVDWGADGAFGGGNDTEHQLEFTTGGSPALATGTWVSLELPLSSFTGLASRSHLAQFIFSAQPVGAATVYIANFYFHK